MVPQGDRVDPFAVFFRANDEQPCSWRTIVLERRNVLAAIAAAIAVAGLPLASAAQEKSITVFAAASLKNALGRD
jgi:hypothetical protein